jgi:hypothetical protein
MEMKMELTKAQERIKTALAEFINMKHPVAIAVETLREKAIERAEIEAKKMVEGVREELKKAGNDLNLCAPYPDSGKLSGWAWHDAHGKYKLFGSLTKWRKSSYSSRDPHLADVDSKMVAKFIQRSKESAAVEYDAFVVKLCRKIGHCKTATINGDHVWGWSFLKVSIVGGEPREEIWKTQQIVNCSKLGLLFNQWPSRKIKK